MVLELVPVERVRTHELVVRQITAEIFAGRLRPGDRLPGERQLSEQLRVSIPSVREAVRILQALEIVRRCPGTGADSGLVVSAQPSLALTELLGMHVALSNYSVAEVMGVRIALETQSVRRIADRLGDVDLAEIEATLRRMSDPGLPRGTFHDLDTDFHLALARCSDNPLLADLMAALRASVRRPMDEAFAGDGRWADRQRVLVREHREIFEAVRDGDATLAVRLLVGHIEGFYDSLQSGGGPS